MEPTMAMAPMQKTREVLNKGFCKIGGRGTIWKLGFDPVPQVFHSLFQIQTFTDGSADRHADDYH